MINTQDLIATFVQETAICKHLASKIPADQYDYTPGDKLRTIKELLEYMCRMGTAPIALLDGYDPDVMKGLRVATEEGDVTTNFDAMMDAQLASMTDFLSTTTQEYMDEEVELFGQTMPRRAFFLHMAVKNFPAYRMQLFQYLKAGLGMSDLQTSNLWMGMDAPQA